MATTYVEKRAAIGQAIKAARLQKKLSQERAASLVATSRFQWIRWEKGENVPGGVYAQRIADVLGIDRAALELNEDEEAALSGDPFRSGSRRDVAADGRADGQPRARAAVTGDGA